MILRHAAVIAALAGSLSLPVAAQAAEISAFDPPASASAPAATRFEFARVRSTIAIGDKVGYTAAGMFCMGRHEVRATNRLEEINTAQAAFAFKAELAAQGLAPAAAEVSAFDSPTTKVEADYRVGGVLQALSFDECTSGTDRKGSISVTVKWEVFAPKLQKVVFTKVTSGSVSAESWEAVNGRDFESRAYTAALRQLMSDPEFRALRPVDGPSVALATTAATTAAQPALHLKSAPPMSGGSQANAAALRQAVVTVLHDNISGSGFYIADGYLLTNRHVVGTTHYVKVKLASGRTVVGEVVRDDARRDVALIKTETINDVRPLHVSMAEPPVGEDVYAIGSPLGQELAGTFTRGVMSGTRENNGLEYLQSDVSINPGNSGGPLLDGTSTVIGMAVAKIDKAAGLSFFIPIREAANSLQLVFD